MTFEDLKETYAGSIDPTKMDSEDYDEYLEQIEESVDLAELFQTVNLWKGIDLQLIHPSVIILERIFAAEEKHLQELSRSKRYEKNKEELLESVRSSKEQRDYEFLNAPYIPSPKNPYYMSGRTEGGKVKKVTLKSRALDFVAAQEYATSTEIRKFMFEEAGHGRFDKVKHRGYYSSYFSDGLIQRAIFSTPSKNDKRVLTRLANGSYQVDIFKGTSNNKQY